MRLVGKQLHCGRLCQLAFYFVCCCSLTETKWSQGKLQQSTLVRLSSSLCRLMVWPTDTLLSAEESQSVRDEQLISSY